MVQALQSYFYTLQNVICFVGGKKKKPSENMTGVFYRIKNRNIHDLKNGLD